MTIPEHISGAARCGYLTQRRYARLVGSFACLVFCVTTFELVTGCTRPRGFRADDEGGNINVPKDLYPYLVLINKAPSLNVPRNRYNPVGLIKLANHMLSLDKKELLRSMELYNELGSDYRYANSLGDAPLNRDR